MIHDLALFGCSAAVGAMLMGIVLQLEAMSK